MFFLGLLQAEAAIGGNSQPRKGFAAIDKKIQACIKNREFPGAVMVVMHHGEVVLKKGWGETTYGSGRIPSPETSVYDVASVSKAISTATCLMHLYEQGKFQLEDKLGKHLPAARGYPLGEIKIADYLAHCTGLPPLYNSNYWLYAANRWKESAFSPVQNEKFPEPFRGRFLPRGFRESMFSDLAQLPLRGSARTVYSDLNYALLGFLVETLSGKRQDRYIEDWLYKKLELRRTCYNPLLHSINQEDIIPTLTAPGWHGWVHDPEAGKLGGVCGAAGVFSTGEELAKIGEFFRLGGNYRGEQILQQETIRKFARERMPGYSRGLGWMKPPLNKGQKTMIPPMASPASFGHQGFTGSILWVDPEKELVVVFMSNLTYPDDAPSAFKKRGGFKQILALAYGLIAG